MKFLTKVLTKNLTRVPLINMAFNYTYFKEHGKEGSCITTAHPLLADDENLKRMLKDMADYIRDNYDMDEII